MEPLDSLTEQVAATWRTVLALDTVGLDDNFFDLGGSSFQLLMVKDRLDTALGVRTELVKFFRHTTIAEVAQHIYGDGHGR